MASGVGEGVKVNKPKRPHEQSLPFVWRRYADDMDRWHTEEVLPVLTEMKEWVGELRTGIVGVAVMAVYESKRLHALIQQITEDT